MQNRPQGLLGTPGLEKARSPSAVFGHQQAARVTVLGGTGSNLYIYFFNSWAFASMNHRKNVTELPTDTRTRVSVAARTRSGQEAGKTGLPLCLGPWRHYLWKKRGQRVVRRPLAAVTQDAPVSGPGGRLGCTAGRPARVGWGPGLGFGSVGAHTPHSVPPVGGHLEVPGDMFLSSKPREPSGIR